MPNPSVFKYGKLCTALLCFSTLAAVGLTACGSGNGGPAASNAPPAPKPEPVSIEELPLPPTAPSATAGSCTTAINPNATGCMSADSEAIQSGSFLPDGHHVVALVNFAGAPAAPDPASIYSGPQLIIVKTDGTKFSNGDAWKCVTCGMPDANKVGVNWVLDYPQTFRDGVRLMANNVIFDCSPNLLTDDGCTPDQLHAYTIRWNTAADGSGAGGSMRELRLHPDNVHIGFNSIVFNGGKFDQYGYFAKLEFNAAPTAGTPLAPRYDLTNVTVLHQDGVDKRVVTINPKKSDELIINHNAIDIGEFRGFSKNGREAFYIGFSWESSNIDVFAADLQTGAVRRMTNNPEYTDPVDSSPDDKWIVLMDTRGSDRQMFMAGMRAIPPVTDLVTAAAASSTRNNGARRFFQPILLDRDAERGNYQGQQLNAGDGSAGSISDPNWNGRADPRWSPDGTAVVYWQSLVTSPACGGANPLPCPDSTEPGGRRTRMMIARLTSRKPLSIAQPAVASDTVPWGTPYVPGSASPRRLPIPEGTYTLNGAISGSAQVQVTQDANHFWEQGIIVDYKNYSDVAGYVINGSESVSATRPNVVTEDVLWYSNLDESGKVKATKLTSSDGFHLIINIATNIFDATGTLTTTIDGHVYTQPTNGT
jgi:hypothetical protein